MLAAPTKPLIPRSPDHNITLTRVGIDVMYCDLLQASAEPDDLSVWLELNDIPAANHVNLRMMPQSDFAALFRRVDAALFTNRAEGGTNLVAMEAMAAGVRGVCDHVTLLCAPRMHATARTPQFEPLHGEQQARPPAFQCGG